MSDAFIVRRGGGGAGASLEITGAVTSPASTVTITNTALGKTYTKTLDAQGKALFKGLKSGTWNITMTDGTQTATGSIVITTEYSKSMFYYKFLYDGSKATEDERQCTDITGGWVYEESRWAGKDNVHTAASFEPGHIKIAMTGNWNSAYRPTNKADLSDYSTIRMKGTVSGGGSSYGIQLAVWSTKAETVLANTNFTQNGSIDITLDISGITGTHYVGIRYSGGNSINYTALITEIRLEP